MEDNYTKLMNLVGGNSSTISTKEPRTDVFVDSSKVQSVEVNPNDECDEFMKIRYTDGTYDNAACLEDSELGMILNSF